MMVSRIEKRVNAVIDADLPVTEAYIGREEASEATILNGCPKSLATYSGSSSGDYDAVLYRSPCRINK